MKVAAGVGILYKDLILLGRRSKYWNGEPMPLGGYWSIFGGSIDENESLQTCAIRELYEETKIHLTITDLVDGCNIIKKDLKLKIFFAELNYQPSPILNLEHDEYGWFDINSLQNFPYDIKQDLIKCVENYKNGV